MRLAAVGTVIVQAPRVLPRVIQPAAQISGSEYNFVFLSSILHAYVGELFAGMVVRGCYQFRSPAIAICSWTRKSCKAEQPAHGAARRALAAQFRRRGAAGGFGHLPDSRDRRAAAAVQSLAATISTRSTGR